MPRSAPDTMDLMIGEPARNLVREGCCAEFTLNDEDDEIIRDPCWLRAGHSFKNPMKSLM